MTNSTSVSSSNELEKEVNDLEVNSNLEEDEVTKKLPGAFRTISEVAEEIHVPQHVLRFWETRFKQIQPVKRSGGRRYYRAEDIALLQYISELLYTQGYTIKGVQRLLEEDFSRFNSTKEVVAEDVMVALNEQGQKEQDQPIENINTESVDSIHTEQDVIEAKVAEITRLKEQNSFLVSSLQSVLVELQELRKIITT